MSLPTAKATAPVTSRAASYSTGGGLTIPLMRRSPRPTQLSKEEWGLWAKNNKAGLMYKYGASTKSSKKKRVSGTNSTINQGADSSFFGTLSIGNPPTSYNVILDTGSSDLWIAGSRCRSCDANTPTFSSSSSTKQLGSSFSITYRTGEAAGQLVTDTVSMAGFAVTDQVFAVCGDVSDNLLSSPVSGLMGLAFETVSSSGARWQNLAQFNADPSAQSEEIGGSFNLGFTNQTLYKGDIDFQEIPDGQETYWIQSLTKFPDCPVTCYFGTDNVGFIDTGTTLIGEPEEVIQGIYAQVPGSRALTGNSKGYYAFPCDQDVQVLMGYGSSSNMWAISPDDFKAFQISETMCVGGFFALDLGRGSESGGNGRTGRVPNWIVGDSFANAYSINLLRGFVNPSRFSVVSSLFVAKDPLPSSPSVSITVPQPLPTTTSISIVDDSTMAGLGELGSGWKRFEGLSERG
ncbi:acid protease [Dendrothele bispora CBS 962.96]|uniref:Acid protease n=1 Tax=Dendrothele bispora (strain CBS 962.96) TaxID=1314807 RepID=A0A4S8LQX1_DENBC|nr:acid protease [Dendrothele bispora CBS 962.96]